MNNFTTRNICCENLIELVFITSNWRPFIYKMKGIWFHRCMFSICFCNSLTSFKEDFCKFNIGWTGTVEKFKLEQCIKEKAENHFMHNGQVCLKSVTEFGTYIQFSNNQWQRKTKSFHDPNCELRDIQPNDHLQNIVPILSLNYWVDKIGRYHLFLNEWF